MKESISTCAFNESIAASSKNTLAKTPLLWIVTFMTSFFKYLKEITSYPSWDRAFVSPSRHHLTNDEEYVNAGMQESLFHSSVASP